MRRIVLTSLALACTAVLAGTAPALADDAHPVPSSPTAQEPHPTPTATAPTDGQAPTPVPREVTDVPSGAPDTGAVPPSSQSGLDGVLIGTAAAVVLAGGATVFVVRRRRATGA